MSLTIVVIIAKGITGEHALTPVNWKRGKRRVCRFRANFTFFMKGLILLCMLFETACIFSKKTPEPNSESTKTVEGNGTGFGGENGLGYSGLIKKTTQPSLPKARVSKNKAGKKVIEDGFKYFDPSSGKEKNNKHTLNKVKNTFEWRSQGIEKIPAEQDLVSNEQESEQVNRSSQEVDDDTMVLSEGARQIAEAIAEEEEAPYTPTTHPSPSPSPSASKTAPLFELVNAQGQVTHPTVVTHEVTVYPTGGPSNAGFILIEGLAAATLNKGAFLPYQNRYASIPPQEETYNLEGSNFTIEAYFQVSSLNISDHATVAAQFPDEYSTLYGQSPTWKVYLRSSHLGGRVEFDWNGLCPYVRDKAKKIPCNNIATARETFEANKWNHFAVVRNGRYVQLYFNGRLQDTKDTREGALFPSHKEIILGKHESVWISSNGPLPYLSGFNGKISQFRLTKGFARYTKDFDPLLEE